MFLSRIVNFGFGPFVVLAVGAYLNPVEQGVYYVFGSLLQLRSLIDLGFSPSSQQLLANRFSDLSLTRKGGVEGRKTVRQDFLNLAKFTSAVYLGLGLLTIIVVGFLGDLFLSSQLREHPHVVWRGAWWFMITCVGMGNVSLGITVVADGAAQVALTNKWRFWSELAALFAFVAVLLIGGGLWASAVMAFTRIWIAIPVLNSLGPAFRSQILSSCARAVSFRKTILPLQSKMMIVWILSFVCYYAYNPLSLKVWGPVFAGAVGMTMQIANMTASLALVWYNTKLPALGNLAGSNNFAAAIKLNNTGARASMGLWILMAAAAWIATFLSKIYIPSFGSRISPMGPISIFLLASGAFVWCHIRGSFVRAFCVEMFVPLAIIQGIGTLLLLLALLPKFGFYGPAITYLLAMGLGAVWTEIGYRSFIRKFQVCKNFRGIDTTIEKPWD